MSCFYDIICRRWVAFCLPLRCFLLIFRVVWVVWGPPDTSFSSLSVRRFSPPFKIRKSAEFSQDTAFRCNLLGTKKKSIRTLFCRGIIDARSASYFVLGSALR